MPNSKHSGLERVVLIGASTGGPGQIENIVKALPPLCHTAIIIAQHIAVDFISSFAKRLGEQTENSVKTATNGTEIEPSVIYISQGITAVQKNTHSLLFRVTSSQESRYNPDIDTVFSSFAPFAKEFKTLGVILTGIGDDGVNGCKELSLMGARTITQSQESAIVDGMPSRARQNIPHIEVEDIQGIKNKIVEFCN